MGSTKGSTEGEEFVSLRNQLERFIYQPSEKKEYRYDNYRLTRPNSPKLSTKTRQIVKEYADLSGLSLILLVLYVLVQAA